MLKDDFVETCRHIWPNLIKEQYLHKTYAGVLCYFEAQTRNLANHGIGIDYSNMLYIIDGFISNQDALSTRSGCIATTNARLPESVWEAAGVSYGERALRLMLSLDIRISSRGESISRARSSIIDWGDGTTLSRTIADHFLKGSSCTRDMVTGRIDPSLSLAYLCTYRGFKVFWTSNLSEHLNISWKSKIITIYEHKIFLWNHLRNSNNPIIPRTILEEAIDTLNLLFPLNDRLTRSFLAQNGKEFQGLGYCSRPRDLCLDLGKFNIWRDRIAELVEIMNEEPKGLKQLALEKDGRNLLPFVTFWIAIAVALLSLLNLPFAVISMKYTIKQYELALAQACSEQNAGSALPQYCSPG
ncbi:hypothetical protein HD806DRAFT_476007 [Xylariaceae sp. AK1471]|nr:hypothetical protein HD806DRAFT_476007 [Xylariaceae sp. AK1471]